MFLARVAIKLAGSIDSDIIVLPPLKLGTMGPQPIRCGPICVKTAGRSIMRLVAVVALYFVSVGPAWWLQSRLKPPRLMTIVFTCLYEPIWLAYGWGPKWLAKLIAAYLRRWGPWDSVGH